MTRKTTKKTAPGSRRPGNGAARSGASRPRRVLVTGVSGYWGGRVARRLQNEPGIELCVGTDKTLPQADLTNIEFVGTRIKSSRFLDVLATRKIDTVVHTEYLIGHEREAMFETNVMGTRHLLAACADVGVRKVIIKSHTCVYGARADNPNFLPETWPIRGRPTHPIHRNFVDNERYIAEFLPGHPELVVTILRFANTVGPTCQTSMTHYLGKTMVPTVLGFDPLFQVIHEDDVVRAMIWAVQHDLPGGCNIAAEGVLPLHRLVRLVGRSPIPILNSLNFPLIKTFSGLPGLKMPPFDLDYLRYLWVADLEKMRTRFRFEPKHGIVETLRSYARSRQGPGSQDADEDIEVSDYASQILDEIIESEEAR